MRVPRLPAYAARLLVGAALAGTPVHGEEATPPTTAALAADPVEVLVRQEPDLPLVYRTQPAFPGTLPRRTRGYQVGDGPVVLDLGIATRTVARVGALTSDQDFYQYVTIGLRPVPLARADAESLRDRRVPTLGGAFLFRLGQDVDGAPRGTRAPEGPDPFRDILDAEIGDGHYAPRVFTGYLEANDLVPGSRLRLGRQYVFHTGAYQLDGGEFAVSLGPRAEGYAYGGRPVTYFENEAGTALAGLGAAFRPWPRGRLEVEYTHAATEDEDSELVTLAAEQTLARGVQVGTRFRALGSDPWDVSVRLSGLLRPLRTTARLRYRQVLSDIGGGAFPITPLTAVLGAERPLANVALEFGRSLAAGIDLTVGGQVQDVTGHEGFAVVDYRRVFARLDLVELPWPGAFLTPSVEHWDTDGDETTGLGLRWTQAISWRLETWVGTDYQRFLFDYLRQRTLENARLYYAGALWHVLPGIDFALDFQAEQNDIPTNEDPLFTIRAWVTCALP